MRLFKISLMAAAATAACNGQGSVQLSSNEQELAIIPRGSTCAELGLGGQQVTIPYPAGGTYDLGGGNSLDLTYYDDTNTIFYFNNSTVRITGVLASIGDRTLMWDMPGGADAWPSLHGPVDFSNGEIYSPEEVAFCFDYELYVQPSPYTHHAQRASWTLTKSGRTDELKLAEGQVELLEYAITVRPGDPVAAGQFVEGPVFVYNLSPHAVTVDAVTTMVGDLAATVTCPTAPPFGLAANGMVECAFMADVPDTSDRNVVGGASVSHGLKVSTVEVTASFTAHNVSTTTFDRCVDVTDDAVPYVDHYLGTVCVEDGEQTFEFSYEAGPFECGAFAVTNTARYVGLDTGATADAAWTVNGEVVCDPGCTLTANYWKRHSHFGPRRYNPIWNDIGELGEDTTFFRSGGSYIQAMWRLALGNPYWTLARAYIAARLNQLSGAQFSPGTVTAFNRATTLFETYAPNQVSTMAIRRQFASAAALLRDFNMGRVGPGRCTCRPDLPSED
jgi:hypothetical protein